MEKNKNTIQVIGSGCPTCKKLFEITQKVVMELHVETPVVEGTPKLVRFVSRV